MSNDPLKRVPLKNPTSFTVNGTIQVSPDYMFNADFDNLGDADATITNPDGTTWVLRAGTSKSIVTGYAFNPVTINATGTIVQVLYTV